MKNNYSDLRGGVERYVAPSLDTLDIAVEAGFQISGGANAWNNSINNNLTWGGTNSSTGSYDEFE